ncbi:hypothetical protein QBC34DRAFT_494222 [Podospora aff. communis PSN243]|uniref:Uncharacterized protein n=1 Tax=Podospora aff. communis PSN243 TaxID=3040156 RepID=A0AAV9GMH6_9PEZI|nr:hypothetical protein QBC34DRAFT_494222 [Podospora aff. communis PSN243]
MHFSLSIVVLALELATAAPIDDPSADVQPFPYGICAFRDRLNARVADFTSWITDCGDKTGHTTGMNIAWQGYNGLCRPLPLNTRALEVHSIAKGCRLTAYESPICSDYPYNGAWRDAAGCLWAGNREFHSYTVTCDNDKEILG